MEIAGYKTEQVKLMMVISSNIKRLREKRKLSQTELSQKIGSVPCLIYNIENYYDSNPTLGTLVKIAMALDCQVGDLFI